MGRQTQNARAIEKPTSIKTTKVTLHDIPFKYVYNYVCSIQALSAMLSKLQDSDVGAAVKGKCVQIVNFQRIDGVIRPSD